MDDEFGEEGEFTVGCPFRRFYPCDKGCMLSVWEKDKGRAYCALAAQVVMGKPELSINCIGIEERE